MSVIAIISSVYVPGSPGSLGDEQKDAGNTAKFIILAVIVKVWPIFEIVVHALATVSFWFVCSMEDLFRLISH